MIPKKILVPIDFNVESLNTLKRALDSLGDIKVEVILMYSEYLSDSITELLFYSPDEKRKKMVTPIFQEGLTILKNRYEKIVLNIAIEFFHGYGSSALMNFVEGQKIDIIFIPKSYTLKPLKNGFNPIPIIKKSKLPYHEIDWERNLTDVHQHQLSHLFN
jgi:hypothetical protein